MATILLCGVDLFIRGKLEAVLPEHRVLKKSDGFPPITNTEIALVAAADANPAARRLAELLAEFCSATPRKVA
jgi:hypothetical protein